MWSSASILGLDTLDTSRWFWSYYGSRLQRRKKSADYSSITVRQGNLQPVQLTIQNNGFDCDTVDEIFIQNIYPIALDRVRRVLDLGGNIGLAALFFHRQFPDAEICSVEPIPQNLELLRINLRLEPTVVHIVPAAAGAKNGTTEFELSDDPRSHSSKGSKGIPNPTMFQAQVLSIPSILEMCGWDEVDLVKIDIEGGETEVLCDRPAWLEKVRMVIGEGHIGSGYSMELCRRDLEPMGFKVDLLRQDPGSFLFLAQRPASAN